MARQYKLLITDDDGERLYTVEGVNILAHADAYGHALCGGEMVKLYTLTGKPVAAARWSDETQRYAKVNPPEDRLAVGDDPVTRLRTARGLTIKELSERSGVGTATIKRLAGGGEATTKTLRALSTALGCGVEELIDGESTIR